MNESKLGTGRTTRMLEYALRQILDAHSQYLTVVMATQAQERYAKTVLMEIIAKQPWCDVLMYRGIEVTALSDGIIKFEWMNPQTLAFQPQIIKIANMNSNIFVERGKNNKYKGVEEVLVDHAVIEHMHPDILEQWTRWDEPTAVTHSENAKVEETAAVRQFVTVNHNKENSNH